MGSPVALLRIEEHMVKLYRRKAECWSSYLKLCIKNDTFIIPETMDLKAKKSMLRLLQAKLRVQLVDSGSSTQPVSVKHKKSKVSKRKPPPATPSKLCAMVYLHGHMSLLIV